jgi:Flp pilus assembly protein TadD
VVSLLTLLASCASSSLFAPPDPQVTRAHVDRGISLISTRDFKTAKTELLKADPFKTGDQRALMALAIASDMEGDFRTSDKAYELLLAQSTDQAALFNNMGYSYMLRGDLIRANSYLAEAERRAPKNDTIRNNRRMLKQVSPL